MAAIVIELYVGSVSLTRYAPDPYKGVRASPGAGALVATGKSVSLGMEQLFSMEMELPAIGVSTPLTVLSEQFLVTEITLPQFQVSAQLDTGRLMAINATLPQFEVAATIDTSEITLPALSMSGSLDAGGMLSGALTLPMFTMEAAAVGDQPYAGTLSLPMFSASGTILPGNAGAFALTFPQFAVESEVSGGVTGVFLLSLPVFEVEGDVYGEYLGEFDLRLPMFQVEAEISHVLAGNVAYALNVMNAALTEYQSYQFNSFARVNGACLAANETGIYLLSGSDDAGTGIQASFKFGKLDFGSSLYKRVVTAYVGYTADESMVLTVATDVTEFKYMLPALGKDGIHTNKKSLAKGARSRYWQFGMYNTNGGDFEVDTVEAVPVILTRRIG